MKRHLLATGIVLIALGSALGSVFWATKKTSEGVVPKGDDMVNVALPKALPVVPVPMPEPVPTPEPAPEPFVAKSVTIPGVPFIVQAPAGQWSDPIFQDGCEEASLTIAAYALSGEPLDASIAEIEIRALAAFQKKKFGHSVDTSVDDTLWTFQNFYQTDAGTVERGVTIEDIQKALVDRSLVLVPADGQKLGNPYFTTPGPPRHMLVVIGYDAASKEFITQDPGTRRGAHYRYAEKTLFDAILDYPTGKHLPIKTPGKAMILIPTDATLER